MDGLENPQPQPSQTRPQQQKENKGLAPRQTWLSFLEVGVFEIFFVGIILVIFFGVMNYFNILPISQIWPKQLGFLPHRESLKQNNTAIKQSSNITIAPISPTDQGTLTSQAKQTLLAFLPTILAPSPLAQSSSDIALIQEKENNKFSSPLNSKDGSGKITLAVSSDGKQLFESLLFFPYTTTAPASIQLAEQIVPQFFLTELEGAWGCKQLPSQATYCENFWEEENGIRKGIGIQEPNPIIKNKNKLFVFFCEHRKESNTYSWKSCAKEFAQTGVQ